MLYIDEPTKLCCAEYAGVVSSLLTTVIPKGTQIDV